MTAVLDKLRQLEMARQRGQISDREFVRIRTQLEGAITDANVISFESATPAKPEPKLWHVLAFGTAVFSVGTVIVAFVIRDVTLALTLAATLLAAGTIHAAQKLKD